MSRLPLSLSLVVMLCTAALGPTPSRADTTADQQALNEAYREYQELMAQGIAGRSAAVEPARRAYEASQRLHDDHPTTAALAINYGNLLEDRRQARDVLMNALRMMESIHGNNALELIDALVPVADVEKDLNDFEAARGHYRRALQIARRHEDSGSMLEGILTLELGVASYNAGRSLDAGRQFNEARDILARHDGTLAQVRLATADLWIGTHHLQAGRSAQAIEPLLNALETFTAFQETLNYVVSNRRMLVEAYEREGNREAAREQALAVAAIGDGQEVHLLYAAQPSLSAGRSPAAVTLRFSVDENGLPDNAEVVNLQGAQRFADAAMASIGGFRYAPRMQGGQPIRTDNVTYTFRFLPGGRR